MTVIFSGIFLFVQTTNTKQGKSQKENKQKGAQRETNLINVDEEKTLLLSFFSDLLIIELKMHVWLILKMSDPLFARKYRGVNLLSCRRRNGDLS